MQSTIIIGAGLAGASAALSLSEREDVLILEAEEPGAGASGVAGGLFSPMIALRGRPVWRIDEAVQAFRAQLESADAAHMFDDRGVLRPAKDEQQVEFFKQSVERCPDHAVWLPPEAANQRFPMVRTPLGAMLATTGGALSLLDYTRRLVDAARRKGARLSVGSRAVSWGEEGNRCFVDIATKEGDAPNERLYARKVIIAGGRLFFSHPSLANLDLHAVKGQTIRLARPDSFDTDGLIPVSGTGYVIPDANTLAVGSSFEHEFEHERVESAVSLDLRASVAGMLPKLAGAKILEEHVGIRVTVPGIRLPMVGPLPDLQRIWVFTGFGSKGLLLAPLLARELPGFIDDPGRIPDEIRVRVKR